MHRLSHFSYDITSQSGEDGMIAELLRELELERGRCVEFGAWDGKHLSNTWDLWKNRGWYALLIEANPRRFEALQSEATGRSVKPICTRVGWEGQQRLDAILAQNEFPPDFDVLSIDIDGDDFRVWRATTSRPKIVVIEYNSSFSPDVKFAQENGAFTGSSAASFVDLAKDKGYVLVGLTIVNLIFVREDLVGELSIEIVSLDELFDRSWLPIVYSDFAGVHHLIKSGQWPYSGMRVDIGSSRVTGPLKSALLVRPLRWAVRHDLPLAEALVRHSRKAYRSTEQSLE